ncbi:MAG: hypothetical protein LBH75_06290 [Treponema sp.]|jgi:hypothetical protein|nr:hypothetical protein [Treponema sp.]
MSNGRRKAVVSRPSEAVPAAIVIASASEAIQRESSQHPSIHALRQIATQGITFYYYLFKYSVFIQRRQFLHNAV